MSLTWRMNKPQLKMINLPRHGYFIHSWSEKASMGTVVNRPCHLLLEGSLEITSTIPFNELF